MTDTTTTHAEVVTKLNDLRAVALDVATVKEAVGVAITGTVKVLEDFAATDGVNSIQGLGVALESSWAEKVNS